MPKLEGDGPELFRTLSKMAARARGFILKRAFPGNRRPGKSRTNKPFSPLTPKYEKRKTKAGRPGVPDQRLSSRTAKSLGVLRSRRGAKPRVLLGFRGRDNIATSLQKRNKFWPLSKSEERRVLDIAEREGRSSAKRFTIRGGLLRMGIE